VPHIVSISKFAASSALSFTSWLMVVSFGFVNAQKSALAVFINPVGDCESPTGF